MSINNIVEKAMQNDPLGMKEAFEAEISTRVETALEEKYKKMGQNKSEVEEDMDDDGQEECSHCEGVGYHEDEDGNKIECPKCEGTGKVPAKGEKSDDSDDDSDDEEEKDEAILTKAARRQAAEKKAAKKSK